MRHNRATKRFGRNLKERTAMLENLVSSLLIHQEIKTTLQKAKAARRLADRVITLGKTDTLAARRQVFSYLQNHTLTSKIFKEVAPRFKNRNGGYTRILQLDRRKGDGSAMALLELTEKEIKLREKAKGKPKQETHEKPRPSAMPEKESHFQKPQEPKKEKPKMGFFKNLSRFFRNKGGG